MSTYRLTGTTIITDGTSNTVTVTESATLEIVVRDYLTAFQHDAGTGSGLASLPPVLVEPEIFHIYLNGNRLPDGVSPQIGRVTWAIDNSTPVIVVDGGEAGISYFRLGGDSFPDLTSLEAAQEFQTSILGYLRVEAGLFGPDTDIAFGTLDCLVGTTENDSIYGRNRGDSVDAGLGNDRIELNGGNDTGYGGDGNDQVYGNKGNDTLYGNAGRDQLFGGDSSTDVLYGGLGNDRIYGGFGNDNLEGGQGDDVLFAGAGRDVLLGQVGEDLLAGGVGRDRITGGADADRFVFALGGNKDVITDFDGAEGDRLRLDRDLWAANPSLTVAEVIAQFATEAPLGIRFNFTEGDALLLEGLDNPLSLLPFIEFV